MELPYEQAIPLLGIYPKKPKTLNQKNMSTPMSTAALVTKCLSVDEWIKKLWNTYTTEYYLVIKKEENSIPGNSMDGPGEHYAK